MAMRRTPLLAKACTVVVVVCASWMVFAAPPTPAQRKELGALTSEIRKVPALISRKKTDEAQAAITDVEKQLEALLGAAEFPENDRQVAALRKQIDLQTAALAKATGGKGGAAPAVSFAKDIAPILVDKCGNCHDAQRASGGLCLENFAAMERGGRSGPLLVAGNPNNSLLMARLASPNPMQRMPRNAEPLSQDEIRKIALWIANGAAFDGTEKDVALSLLKANPMAATEKIEIAKATGNETVSFVRDIAPTFVNTCGGCHNAGPNPRGGFSLATFERVMAGGESGKVIVPGKPEESRLWRLVNADDEPVMPQGNMARITRKWHADLRTWITEGAKFDGSDAKRPLAELIPTPEQMEAEKLAKLTPDQWIEKRLTDSQELWQRTFPQGDEAVTHQTDNFLVMGDVAPRRLEEVGQWAEEQATALRTMFNVKDQPLFKGKLAIFVFKERFGYEEFNNTVHRRQVPREVTGHSQVTTAQSQAFAAMQDTGDEATSTTPNLQLNVIEQVTGAFLKRDGGNLPDWLSRGAGLAIAAGKSGGNNPYIMDLHARAAAALQKSNLQNPAELFNNGQFSPADVGPIGYSLVEFLLKQGGAPAFGQLVRRFQAGDAPNAALQNAYRSDARQLGAAFLTAFGSRR
ncbi:hypothetical protein GC163_20005 [bacterium]|nr:hypothetical protein [bacterium]